MDKILDYTVKFLAENSERKYRNFIIKLTTNLDKIYQIYGVKIPKIRVFSKKILKKFQLDDVLEFINLKSEIYEINLIKAFLINRVNISENLRINLTKNFVAKIDNWGVCDIFCEKKNFKTLADEEIWYKFLLTYKDEKCEFTKRFFYVFLLKNFLTKKYLADFFKILKDEKSEFYYTQMAAAWAICEFATNGFESEIFEFLSSWENEKIKKIAVSKIMQSLKFSHEQKTKFKNLITNK